MEKKGILLLHEVSDEEIQRLQEIAPDYEFIKGEWETESIDFPLENIEVIFGWGKLGEEILDLDESQLKWIQYKSAGVDTVDMNTLKEKNILLTNSSGIHSTGIAESIFGMLLSYTRRIGFALLNQQKNEWNQDIEMKELTKKTMMIVGTGNIGKATGKLAKAFGMKTIGINRSGGEVEHMDELYTQENLADHIGEADIVVNILPLTEETEGLFDKSLFSKMKEGSIFVNVGRGKSVKTDDLIDALDNGNLEYAALDVFEEEPLPEDHPLWDRDDVLVTPHFSGFLEYHSERLLPIFEKNLEAFVAGEELPINLVDYESGY